MSDTTSPSVLAFFSESAGVARHTHDERLWNCREEQTRKVAAMVHEAVTKDVAAHITLQLFLAARTNFKP